MEASEQIKRFGDFLEKNYKRGLVEAARKGQNFLVIEFSLLAKFDPSLAEELLETPEEVLKAAQLAAEQFDLGEGVKNFKIRVNSIPESQNILIRNIRSKHIGIFLMIEGIVRQKSDVRPQVTSAKFECPSCGKLINVLQLGSSFKEPMRCGCGRKGKFRMISKELVDAQSLVLEENPEKLTGGEQPKRMRVFLQDDLVSPIGEKKTNPGNKIRVIGQVKEVPIISKIGGTSTRYDLLVEANYVEGVEETFLELEISPKEEKVILELSKEANRSYQRFIDSIAPSIYGHEKIKEALLLQLMGGTQKTRSDGVVSRGDIHILLVGDPGSGKSQLLKRVNIIAPKGRYVSGKGVSGAGLTASVVRDEFLRGWSLEAGALVLANGGICLIDEMDKMTPEDRGAMHEAMEQQSVSISKANIQATLLAKTTILAAANPKIGRFDAYEILARQIDLPPTLLNRFDLIFPIKDIPEKEADEKMATHILNLHQNPDVKKPDIPTETFRRYIAFARQRKSPKLTNEALEEIKKYYLQTRGQVSNEEGAARSIPITPRQLEAAVRLSEASARVRLSDAVTKGDAKRAVELLHFCLMEVGFDTETGKIDIDRISSGMTATERSKIVVVREIITELESRLGKTIPIDDVVRRASEVGIKEADVEETIEKLKRSGDVFEPRKGFISRI